MAIKVDKLNLYSAIYDVYTDFEQCDMKPRSADWLIYIDKRKTLCECVRRKLPIYFTYSEEDILKSWDDFGKNKVKYKEMIQVLRSKNRVCIVKKDS